MQAKNLNLGLFYDLSLSSGGGRLELNLGIFKEYAHFTYAKYFYARKLSAKFFINKLLLDFAYAPFFAQPMSTDPIFYSVKMMHHFDKYTVQEKQGIKINIRDIFISLMLKNVSVNLPGKPLFSGL